MHNIVKSVLVLFLVILAINNCYAADNKDKSFDITYDLSKTAVLNDFDDNKKFLLMRQLSADCSWKVSRYRNNIVAQKCFFNVKGNRVTNLGDNDKWVPGNQSGKLNNIQLRITLSFVAPYETYFLSKGLFKADKKEAVVKPSAFSDDNKPFYWPLTIMGTHGLALTIDDSFAYQEKDITRKTIARMCEELQQVLDNSLELEKKGFIKELTPSKSIKVLDNNTLEVVQQKDSQNGILKVSGYVNPGELGYITVHVFDKKNNKELSSAKTFRTLEYVGWSNNPKERFYFESKMTVDDDMLFPENTPRDVTFSVIFHPAANPTAFRELVSIDKTILLWNK